jgi:hypothetical protein
MEWIRDVERGAWLRERLDPSWRDMHIVVPHGFEAYARVLHPVIRDRPANAGTWHGHGRTRHFAIEQEPVTWEAVAEVFGAEMDPLIQYGRLVWGQDDEHGEVLDDSGWRYGEPEQGNLDAGMLAAVTAQLARHTGTPDTGVAAVWDGWSGLTSSAGYAPLTAWKRWLPRFAGPSVPGTGLLPPEVADGPRLDLPDRAYFLFEAGARVFTDPSWAADAPWTREGERPQSPSILWPEDRAWVLVTEIDYDSTIVAGSLDLVTDLLREPAVEALPIPEGAFLSWG